MGIKSIKNFLLFLFISLLIVLGVYYKYTCDNDAQRFYNQGSKLFKQKKYSDAYYNFIQIKKFSKLYELSLLKEYQCANLLSDKKNSLKKLREIIKTTKSEQIKSWALYNEAVLSRELGLNNDNQSYRKFNYIYKTYQESDFAVASAYRAAQLASHDKNISKEMYLKYLSYAPNGRYSLSAIDELTKLNLEFNKEDSKIIADALFANGKYQNAYLNYKKIPFSNSWYDISKTYRALNDKQNEKETILKGLALSISSVDEKEISSAIDRLINISNANKAQYLQELYTKYQKTYIFPTIVYKLAEASSTLRAIKLYELLVNEYPDSIWSSNALWELFWYNYQQNRFKTCEKLAKKHIMLYPKTQDAPRIAYWYGRTLLKLRKNITAREVFLDIIHDFPTSYYSFLSARQLKLSKAKKMIIKKPIEAYDINNINSKLFDDKLLLELANRGEWELIDELKINNENIKSWIANKKGNYQNSINITKENLEKEMNENQDYHIPFADYRLKLLYPVVYSSEINKHAQNLKQSPYLFLSLVREESHFDKNAKSSVGARGLSQLMPSTANFIEKKPTTTETLLNPEENIRIGLKYFEYLYNYFNKNEYLAILAYNAGPGNIKKWLNDATIKSDEIDIFVENIPYLETKNYIKKILSSYWMYINVYSSKNK